METARSSAWLFTSLWKANADRCQLGIVDTVLVGGGDFSPRWLFTSKNGDVVKKKEILAPQIRERFKQIALATPSNQSGRIAVVRYSNGNSAVMDGPSFESVVGAFPPKVIWCT